LVFKGSFSTERLFIDIISYNFLYKQISVEESSAAVLAKNISGCEAPIPHGCTNLASMSVAGPTVWNLLPDQLKNSGCTELTFRRTLKTFFFDQY